MAQLNPDDAIEESNQNAAPDHAPIARVSEARPQVIDPGRCHASGIRTTYAERARAPAVTPGVAPY